MLLTDLNTLWKATVTEKADIGTELKSKKPLDLVCGGLQDTTSCISQTQPSGHT